MTRSPVDFMSILKFDFKVVLCRIRLFPTMISKIKWLWSELPLSSTGLFFAKIGDLKWFFGKKTPFLPKIPKNIQGLSYFWQKQHILDENPKRYFYLNHNYHLVCRKKIDLVQNWNQSIFCNQRKMSLRNHILSR